MQVLQSTLWLRKDGAGIQEKKSSRNDRFASSDNNVSYLN